MKPPVELHPPAPQLWPAQVELAVEDVTSNADIPAMPPLPPEAAARLEDFLAQIKALAPSFVGYPCSQDYEYPEVAPLLRFALNNIHSMRFVRRDGGWATVILSTNKNDEARRLLLDCMI